jgi:hypothetical protein
MLAIIMLTSFAVIMLLIGFFEIRLPFVNRGNAILKKEKKLVKEPSKSIEVFYRTIRVENWLHKIQQLRNTDITVTDSIRESAIVELS